ncbi:hypothetical protein KUCAC02_002571, partial [Chaenocephalus aceratus]
AGCEFVGQNRAAGMLHTERDDSLQATIEAKAERWLSRENREASVRERMPRLSQMPAKSHTKTNPPVGRETGLNGAKPQLSGPDSVQDGAGQRPPLTAGFSRGGEGVHLKDEKTCAFKRA